MVNKVILIGNVGADPEIRAFESGNTVARMRVATSEKFRRDGEVKTISEWHNIEAWGKAADIIDQYVRKGDRVYIEGSLHYAEYTPKDGVERHQTIIRVRNITMLTQKRETGGVEQTSATTTSNAPNIDELF